MTSVPVHNCPYCQCGEVFKVNPDAPFHQLVLLIDRLTYGRRPR